MKTLLRAVVALAATGALLPATASAEVYTFGSDLSGDPDVMDNTHLADTLFFNSSAKNSHRAPASGEILAVRIKGRVVPHGGGREDLSLFHTQVLRPNTDGSMTVDSSSQHLYFPVGGRADEVHTFVPSVQCVKAGDTIDFNHIGGWDGGPVGTGTQYQIFKTDPTSQNAWYEHDQGTNIGARVTPTGRFDGLHKTFTPAAPYGRELMMQIVVGSGFDSSNLCEGGLKGYEYAGAEILPQTFTVYDNGIAGARVSCTSGRGFCAGTARLEVDGVELGRASFKIDRAATSNVKIPLTNDGARIVNTRGLVDATVIVDSQDDIGQQRTTTGVATLKSARPTAAGFSGTTVRAQALPVKNGTFAFKATCPLGTQGACTGTVSISSQKRVILRRGTRGSVYKVAAGTFSIAPGKTARVPMKLSPSGKKVFKKVKSLVTIATVTTTDGAGQSVSKRSKLTLKRR